MIQSKENQQKREQYRGVLTLLDLTLRFFEGIKLEPELLKTYKQILYYLRTRSDEEISSMLETRSKRKTISHAEGITTLTDEDIRSLTTEQVREQVSEARVTRAYLERIATVRFGVTRGALSNLRSRDALIEKILTLTNHENTHESIARAVNAKTAAD